MSRFSSVVAESRGLTGLKQWVVLCRGLASAGRSMLIAGMRSQKARSVMSALGQGLQHGVV